MMKAFFRDIGVSLLFAVVMGILCCGIYPLAVFALGQVAFNRPANGSLVTDPAGTVVGSGLIGQPFAAPQYFHPRPSAAGNSAGSSYSATGGYDAGNSSGTNYGPLSDTLLNGQIGAPAVPATAPDTAAAPATTAAAASTTPAVTAQAAVRPAKVVYFDGIRLRVIHYALENRIAFKLYSVKFTADGAVASRMEVPLSRFEDKEGKLNDVALIDAFPHAGDPADKVPVIAADFATAIPADAVTASGSGLDPHISPANAALQAARVAKVRGMSEGEVRKLIEENTDGPTFGVLGDPGVNVLMLNLALDKARPMSGRASPTVPYQAGRHRATSGATVQ